MASTAYAIKKLEKAGAVVEVVSEGNNNARLTATFEHHVIDLTSQYGDVCTIRLRTKTEKDDYTTDYHAGSFHSNISEALRSLEWSMGNWDENQRLLADARERANS